MLFILSTKDTLIITEGIFYNLSTGGTNYKPSRGFIYTASDSYYFGTSG